eukprot:bmy_17886T0
MPRFMIVGNKVRKRVSLKRLGGNAVTGFVITRRARSASFSSVPKVRCCLPGLWEDAAGQGGSDVGRAFLGAGRSGVCGGLGPAHLWSLFKEAHALPRRESRTLRRLTPWARSAPPPGPAPATRRRGGL